MPAPVSEILQDMIQALRAGGQFAAVSLGSGTETCVPRLRIEYEGQEVFRPDDMPDGRWVRLRAKVVVHTRTQSPAQGVARLSELCDAAIAALMADPYRGGQCRDLPIGRATEIDRIDRDHAATSPEAQASFVIRCHLEM
jgi:hypothetical protein